MKRSLGTRCSTLTRKRHLPGYNSWKVPYYRTRCFSSRLISNYSLQHIILCNEVRNCCQPAVFLLSNCFSEPGNPHGCGIYSLRDFIVGNTLISLLLNTYSHPRSPISKENLDSEFPWDITFLLLAAVKNALKVSYDHLNELYKISFEPFLKNLFVLFQGE